MSQGEQFLRLLSENKARAEHWRAVHFSSPRYYQVLEWFMGIASIILATCLLGAAGYMVDRNSAPLPLQFGLLGIAILQACISAVQSYMRPAALSERYRTSASNFGSLVRRWDLIQMKSSLGVETTMVQLDEMMAAVDMTVREALQAPWIVLKWKGMPSRLGN